MSSICNSIDIPHFLHPLSHNFIESIALNYDILCHATGWSKIEINPSLFVLKKHIQQDLSDERAAVRTI